MLGVSDLCLDTQKQRAEFRAGLRKRFIIRLKYDMQVTRTRAGKIL